MPRMQHRRDLDENTLSHRARRRVFDQLARLAVKEETFATFQRDCIAFGLGALAAAALGLWQDTALLAAIGLILVISLAWLIRLAQVDGTKLR